jgi:hypothetical protein
MGARGYGYRKEVIKYVIDISEDIIDIIRMEADMDNIYSQ